MTVAKILSVFAILSGFGVGAVVRLMYDADLKSVILGGISVLIVGDSVCYVIVNHLGGTICEC